MNPLESWVIAGLVISIVCIVVVRVAQAITPRPRNAHAHRMNRLERAELEMRERSKRNAR